jgi:diphthine synthase
MTLYMIGLGLDDEKDITVKGLEAVKKCTAVFLENYTSFLSATPDQLERFYGKKIILADRALVEKGTRILERAKKEECAFLVPGDVFCATTHIDLYLRALKEGIDVHVIHNASVLTAVGMVGLEMYKFGRTASVPFPEGSYAPTSYYDVIAENQKSGAHTLVLLDIKTDQNRFMTVQEGINLLLLAEEKHKKGVISGKTMAIGVARLGGKRKIAYAPLEKMARIDFGSPLHAIIIPGKLHFIEEEALEQWKE